MQEMRCSGLMFMILGGGGRAEDGIDLVPNLFPGVKFKREMLRAKSLTMWVHRNKLQVYFYWCLYRFFKSVAVFLHWTSPSLPMLREL